MIRRPFRILSKTQIQESQGNGANNGSHRVPMTPLYTILFLTGLMDLKTGFSDHRVHGGALRPARASPTAGPGGWWRPAAGRLLTANRRAVVTANRWAVSHGSGQRPYARPVRDTDKCHRDVSAANSGGGDIVEGAILAVAAAFLWGWATGDQTLLTGALHFLPTAVVQDHVEGVGVLAGERWECSGGEE